MIVSIYNIYCILILSYVKLLFTVYDKISNSCGTTDPRFPAGCWERVSERPSARHKNNRAKLIATRTPMIKLRILSERNDLLLSTIIGC